MRLCASGTDSGNMATGRHHEHVTYLHCYRFYYCLFYVFNVPTGTHTSRLLYCYTVPLEPGACDMNMLMASASASGAAAVLFRKPAKSEGTKSALA